MDEDKLIKKLKDVSLVEPQDPEFFEKLETRLVARRAIVQKQKSLAKARRIKIWDFKLLFSSVAFMSIISVAIVVLLQSSPGFSSNSNQSPQNNDGQSANILMEIGNEKVFANEFNLENLFVEFKLPQAWKLQNENYNLANNEFPVFKNDKEVISFFSKDLEISSDTEVSKLNVPADFNVYSIADSDEGITEEINESLDLELNTQNYLVEIGDPDLYMLYSTEQSEVQDFLDAVVGGLNYSSPIAQWLNFRNDEFSFVYDSKWQTAEDIQNTTLNKILKYEDSELTTEFQESIVMEKLSGTNNDVSGFDDVYVYGKLFKRRIDSPTVQTFINGDREITVTKSIILNTCNLNGEAACLNGISKKSILNENEVNLILWSLEFTAVPNEEGFIFDSEFNYEFTYASNITVRKFNFNAGARSVVEEVLVALNDNEMRVYVFNKLTNSFANDLQQTIGNFEWQTSPTKSNQEIGGTNFVKTEGIAKIDDLLTEVTIYVYSNDVNSFAIVLKNDFGEANSLDEVLNSFKINEDE